MKNITEISSMRIFCATCIKIEDKYYVLNTFNDYDFIINRIKYKNIKCYELTNKEIQDLKVNKLTYKRGSSILIILLSSLCSKYLFKYIDLTFLYYYTNNQYLKFFFIIGIIFVSSLFLHRIKNKHDLYFKSLHNNVLNFNYIVTNKQKAKFIALRIALLLLILLILVAMVFFLYYGMLSVFLLAYFLLFLIYFGVKNYIPKDIKNYVYSICD